MNQIEKKIKNSDKEDKDTQYWRDVYTLKKYLHNLQLKEKKKIRRKNNKKEKNEINMKKKY